MRLLSALHTAGAVPADVCADRVRHAYVVFETILELALLPSHELRQWGQRIAALDTREVSGSPPVPPHDDPPAELGPPERVIDLSTHAMRSLLRPVSIEICPNGVLVRWHSEYRSASLEDGLAEGGRLTLEDDTGTAYRIVGTGAHGSHVTGLRGETAFTPQPPPIARQLTVTDGEGRLDVAL